MKRALPIIVILVAVGIVAGVLLTRDKKEPAKANSTSQSSSSEASGEEFDPAATTGVSFVATMKTTSNGKTVETVVESDAKSGAIRSTGSTGGETMSIIYTKDAYYMCQTPDKCFKYAIGQGAGASFDPSTYQYDASKIAELKTTSKSLGQESCASGKCNVWQVTNGNYTSKIYIDTKTKHVTQAVTEVSGVTSTISYEYKDVIVEVPTNAQELPKITAPTQ